MSTTADAYCLQRTSFLGQLPEATSTSCPNESTLEELTLANSAAVLTLSFRIRRGGGAGDKCQRSLHRDPIAYRVSFTRRRTLHGLASRLSKGLGGSLKADVDGVVVLQSTCPPVQLSQVVNTNWREACTVLVQLQGVYPHPLNFADVPAALLTFKQILPVLNLMIILTLYHYLLDL